MKYEFGDYTVSTTQIRTGWFAAELYHFQTSVLYKGKDICNSKIFVNDTQGLEWAKGVIFTHKARVDAIRRLVNDAPEI